MKQSKILDRDAYFLCQKARQQQPVEKGEIPDSEGKKGDPDQKVSNLRDKFICAHPSQGRNIESEEGSTGSDTKLTNHNKIITDELEKLAQAYKNSNDTWRAFGYQKAISGLASNSILFY